jgi:hypothetical protein
VREKGTENICYAAFKLRGEQYSIGEQAVLCPLPTFIIIIYAPVVVMIEASVLLSMTATHH